MTRAQTYNPSPLPLLSSPLPINTIFATMSPSRGNPVAVPHSDDLAVAQQSESALLSAKRNFNYLINPSSTTNHPSRFRTRALLRSVRYISTFIFWRLIRYAKFVAVGAVVTAIGATAFGSVITGVAWVAAPTSMAAAIVSASVWGVGKWGARRLNKRWKSSGGDEGVELREVQESSVKSEGTWRKETGPEAVPW